MIITDTHTWWWAISEPERLSPKAMSIVRETPLGKRRISAISKWEFTMMATRGRIELTGSLKEWLETAITQTGIQVLHQPISHWTLAHQPGVFHKDPCDRIIVATARCNNCMLLTADQKILSQTLTPPGSEPLDPPPSTPNPLTTIFLYQIKWLDDLNVSHLSVQKTG